MRKAAWNNQDLCYSFHVHFCLCDSIVCSAANAATLVSAKCFISVCWTLSTKQWRRRGGRMRCSTHSIPTCMRRWNRRDSDWNFNYIKMFLIMRIVLSSPSLSEVMPTRWQPFPAPWHTPTIGKYRRCWLSMPKRSSPNGCSISTTKWITIASNSKPHLLGITSKSQHIPVIIYKPESTQIRKRHNPVRWRLLTQR